MGNDQPLREGQIVAGPLFNESMMVETVRTGYLDCESGRHADRALPQRHAVSRRSQNAEALGTTYSYAGDGKSCALDCRLLTVP
jgi:hypothetical protein